VEHHIIEKQPLAKCITGGDNNLFTDMIIITCWILISISDFGFFDSLNGILDYFWEGVFGEIIPYSLLFNLVN
jgi:hypothetical protein